MATKGKKDKGRRETKKKAKLTLKEKRRKKKEKAITDAKPNWL
jgi:hypothetical protein